MRPAANRLRPAPFLSYRMSPALCVTRHAPPGVPRSRSESLLGTSLPSVRVVSAPAGRCGRPHVDGRLAVLPPCGALWVGWVKLASFALLCLRVASFWVVSPRVASPRVVSRCRASPRLASCRCASCCRASCCRTSCRRASRRVALRRVVSRCLASRWLASHCLAVRRIACPAVRRVALPCPVPGRASEGGFVVRCMGGRDFGCVDGRWSGG
jgi:hypothetical protein